MVEIGLRTVWESFVYSFGGKYYLQSDGGPIGARITMAAARIVMFDWSCHYRALLEDICLWCPLLKYYVDDFRQITGKLKHGVRFSIEDGRFVEKEEWIEDDRKRDSERGITSRMAEECRKAMNSINPDVQFTTETADDFPEKRLH